MKNNEYLFCDKKYEIIYCKGAGYKNATEKLQGVKCVKGTLINYDSPFTGRFFIENENGALEIIPMISVVEMREITQLRSNNNEIINEENKAKTIHEYMDESGIDTKGIFGY